MAVAGRGEPVSPGSDLRHHWRKRRRRDRVRRRRQEDEAAGAGKEGRPAHRRRPKLGESTMVCLGCRQKVHAIAGCRLNTKRKPRSSGGPSSGATWSADKWGHPPEIDARDPKPPCDSKMSNPQQKSGPRAGIGCSAGTADAGGLEEVAGVDKTTAGVAGSLHPSQSRVRVDYSSGFRITWRAASGSFATAMNSSPGNQRSPIASCRRSFRAWPTGSLRARLSASAACL